MTRRGPGLISHNGMTESSGIGALFGYTELGRSVLVVNVAIVVDLVAAGGQLQGCRASHFVSRRASHFVSYRRRFQRSPWRHRQARGRARGVGGIDGPVGAGPRQCRMRNTGSSHTRSRSDMSYDTAARMPISGKM